MAFMKKEIEIYNMSSITIRVPLAQYSYLEYQFEGTVDEAIEEHNEVIRKYNEILKANADPTLSKLTPAEWNNAIDGYLSSQTVDIDYFDRMSERQKRMFNELKKSFNRLSSKNNYKE